MAKALIIVESPTKIRTIKKYLGKDYSVSATIGHIKDLPSKDLGVDVKNNFTPTYTTVPGKTKVIKKLKLDAKNTTDIYLAQDPDREGEAIAWHTADVLKKKGRNFYRVLFYELTKSSMLKAISNPQDLNKGKYKAQQARRILDRLVGYELSPLLWNKVKRGLSAGRVQSVSVKIICDREKQIYKFRPAEYWSITATLQNQSCLNFDVRLLRKNNKKFEITSKESANKILKKLDKTQFIVKKITTKIKNRKPMPPFTTSTLQQESIKKLKFSASKTMLIAQQLYEGIEIGPKEPTGLITYMRTDSVRVSEEAASEARSIIDNHFGKEYSIKKPRVFKNQKKIQDAHEAIRPTSVFNTPENIKPYLSEDQIKLYTLIWRRFIASQMKKALIDQNTIVVQAGKYTFNATGSVVKFQGFMKLLQISDISNKINDSKKQTLPEKLNEGEILSLKKITSKQHFTAPPPRFSEASLVKELEENGIGRPSTYATILSNIRTKGYVEMHNRYFKPTELGLIVNELLSKNFPEIIDVEFTAKMETEFDRIEQSETNILNVLNQFYRNFEKELIKAKNRMISIKKTGMPTDLKCPDCKKHLSIKLGKNGHFIACQNYPNCTYSSNYERNARGDISIVKPFEIEITDKNCNLCGKPMAVKLGKYGKFLSCTDYPACKNATSIRNPWEKKEKVTEIGCPYSKCPGKIVEKFSKRGKQFYGCNQFPKCSFASWYKPINKACPECKSTYLIEKTTKQNGTFVSCPIKKCSYVESI